MSSGYALTQSMRVEACIDRELMFDLKRLLLDYGCIEGLSDSLKGLGSHPITLTSLLRRITEATFSWGKPYELIRNKRLAEGDARLGFQATKISVRTAQRGMRVLEDAALVFTISGNQGTERYYALNVPAILEKVADLLNKVDPRTIRARECRELFSKIRESENLSRICEFIQALAGSVVSDMEAFIKKATDTYRGMTAMLSRKIEQVKEQVQVRADEKRQQHGKQPLYHAKNGKPQVKAATALWHSEVRDADIYSGYTPQTTQKMRGMMKNYLTELRSMEMTEEDVRAHFRDVVRKWQFIPDSKRRIQAVSQNGKAYKVLIPSLPDFAFYYAYRGEMNALLASITVSSDTQVVEQQGPYDFFGM